MPFSLGVNYRMNEMTGAVLRGQLRKLNTILAQYRQKSRFVKDSIKDLHGIKLRQSNDPKGEIGWTVDLLLPDKKIGQVRDRDECRERSGVTPRGRRSAHRFGIEQVSPHPAWPVRQPAPWKGMVYGAQRCP
jgi:hypothetical protein